MEKILTIGFCASTLLASGLVTFLVERQDEAPGTVKWRVRKARAEGKEHVTIHQVGDPPVVTSLGHALRGYSVILVKPVAKRTSVEDGREIHTWYACRVIDNLSRRPPLAVGLPTPSLGVRLAFRSSAHELLVFRGEGSVVRDGVTVTATESIWAPAPGFSIGRSYLLFLNLDSSGDVGTIPLLAEGIFELQGPDRLIAWGNSSHPVVKEINSAYGGSFAKFREALRSRE